MRPADATTGLFLKNAVAGEGGGASISFRRQYDIAMA
jgi:hypothetical protein